VDVHSLALPLKYHGVSLRPNLLMEILKASLQNQLDDFEILPLKSRREDELNDEGLKLRVQHDDFENLLAVVVHAHLEEGRLDEGLVEPLILIPVEEDERVDFVIHGCIVQGRVPEVVLHGQYLLADFA
jgi:hypothetical protein